MQAATMVEDDAKEGKDVRFWVILLGLVLVLLSLPVLGIKVAHLDSRTPYAIAEHTLRHRDQLKMVDSRGKIVPEGTGAPTVSVFEVTAGSVTKNVPFSHLGKPVRCTITVPTSDPRSVRASCEPAKAGSKTGSQTTQ